MTTDLVNSLKCWLDAGLSFFYPEVCQYCGEERATAAEGFIGARCRDHVKFIEPPFCKRCGLPYEGDLTTPFECANCREMELHFCQARSAVEARGLVLEVIHRYKYKRALWFEPFLAGLLVERAAPVLQREKWDMIVPVPLHPVKQSEREFNQSDRLARQLSRATGIPVNTGLLRRPERTRTQALLSRTERAVNVRHAFALQADPSLQGKRVVVVDDVFTTGATASACAKLLLGGGANEVCAWTLARGLLR